MPLLNVIISSTPSEKVVKIGVLLHYNAKHTVIEKEPSGN